MRRKAPCYMMEKQYRAKASIHSIAGGLRDSFDKAYEIGRSNIEVEIREARAAYDNLSEALKVSQRDEDGRLSEEAFRIIDRQVDRGLAIQYCEEALLALEEMRLAFLFKSMEISIKEMMSIAFPKLNKKELFRWDLVTTHLKANGIPVKEIAGYSEADALRIINNHIKHALASDQESKDDIACWNRESDFTDKKLLAFYEQVKPKIIEFLENLGNAIVKAVYDLDDASIESMADDIAGRLSTSQAATLLKKVKNKYPNLA